MATTSVKNVSMHFCNLCSLSVSGDLEGHEKGKRHQNAAKKVEKEEKGIFVIGFPNKISDSELRQILSRYGHITNFIVGNNRRYVIVEYKDRSSAQAALSSPSCIQGRKLKIKSRVIKDFMKNTGVEPYSPDHKQITAVLSTDTSFDHQLRTLMAEVEFPASDKLIISSKICLDLDIIFKHDYAHCKTQVFGSLVTGLAFKGSDIDVFLDANYYINQGQSMVSLEHSVMAKMVKTARKQLQGHSYLFRCVLAIPKAKVPLVKFFHRPTEMNCDLSFRNALGVQNSILIRFYLSLDPRIKPLLFILKYWSQKNDLSGSGKLNNYALAMMTLFYFQQLDDPIVPSVFVLQNLCQNKRYIDGWECSFTEDTSKLKPISNVSSIPQLLHGFFKYYGHFDFGFKVICPLLGHTMSKSAFEKLDELPSEMNKLKEKIQCEPELGLKVDSPICIQDPFELNRNLTNGTSLKIAENFKNFCLACEKLCDDSLLNDEFHSDKLLNKIFEESSITALRMNKDMTQIVISPTSHIPNDLLKKLSIAGGTSSENVWVSLVYDTILRIFKNVLRLEVIKTEHDKNPYKITKLELVSDVVSKREPKVEADVQVSKSVISCAGHYSLWEGRKSAKKKTPKPENFAQMSLFEREELISQFILDTRYKGYKASAHPKVIEFDCKFHPSERPIQVELSFTCISKSNLIFLGMIGYLKTTVQHFVDDAVKHFNKE